jgi:hypothetical protein
MNCFLTNVILTGVFKNDLILWLLASPSLAGIPHFCKPFIVEHSSSDHCYCRFRVVPGAEVMKVGRWWSNAQLLRQDLSKPEAPLGRGPWAVGMRRQWQRNKGLSKQLSYEGKIWPGWSILVLI